MKRKWLYIGVGFAALLQTIIQWFWIDVLFKSSYAALAADRFASVEIPVTFLSKIAFALVVGFFYLHVPDEKRSVRAGSTIGAILGLLIGIYQLLDWHAAFNVPFSLIAMELAKTLLLGALSGLTISFAEIKMNSRRQAVHS